MDAEFPPSLWMAEWLWTALQLVFVKSTMIFLMQKTTITQLINFLCSSFEHTFTRGWDCPPPPPPLLFRPVKLCLHESSNPGSTHFRSWTEFQSTNECGLSLQSGLVGSVHPPSYSDQLSCVYTRVLTRVQLTFGPEPSSNPPMNVGWVYNQGWLGAFTLEANPDWIRVRTLV